MFGWECDSGKGGFDEKWAFFDSDLTGVRCGSNEHRNQVKWGQAGHGSGASQAGLRERSIRSFAFAR
jgi:hypothetical protein